MNFKHGATVTFLNNGSLATVVRVAGPANRSQVLVRFSDGSCGWFSTAAVALVK